MSSPGDGVDWRPSASRQALEARAGLLARIREFFAARHVLEVETPLLSCAANTDVNIESLGIEAGSRRYLRTSPEFAMKRLLAAGAPDIYEMGRVFRGGEAGRQHNPEFTLLEWYRLGWSHLELAGEVLDLLRHCAAGAFDDWPVQRLTYRELFQQHLGLDPFQCDESDCAGLAAESGIRAGPLDHQGWLDLLLSHLVQPALEPQGFTVVDDFPPAQAALARVRADRVPVAERFEIYLGRMELANGYRELTDAGEQRRRFERDNRLRALRGMQRLPADENLLLAMQHGLPDCAGVALGVDRLLMAILQLDDIGAVIAFPDSRA